MSKRSTMQNNCVVSAGCAALCLCYMNLLFKNWRCVNCRAINKQSDKQKLFSLSQLWSEDIQDKLWFQLNHGSTFNLIYICHRPSVLSLSMLPLFFFLFFFLFSFLSLLSTLCVFVLPVIRGGTLWFLLAAPHTWR